LLWGEDGYPSMIDPREAPKVLELYLEITRYPILSKKIRERMREELFSRRIIAPDVFEKEVREKAIHSQLREGLANPYEQEAPEVWQERVRQIRDHLTDFYFAYNLPHSLFVEIVQSTLKDRRPEEEIILTFNPQLAPWDMLFAKAEEYESYPPEKKARVKHHLQEIIVVLIKGMISDQLAFIGIAKNIFTIADLKEIRRRRIGRGKIGGKAAGLMLAHRILQHALEQDDVDPALRNLGKEHITIPDSYFIGSDVFYEFHELNGLHDFHDQKYKTRDEIVADYPRVVDAFARGRFPEEVVARLRQLLQEVGQSPLIVRSSSLLEDSFGSSFAGKYDSYFYPNQGTLDQNLAALAEAIKCVYASVHNPSAMLYRRQKGLLDYDERMAILIQKVEGKKFGHYFFPMLAGVAFSRNPFRWNRKIRREDGFLRMVWGLGTRAVDRVADDYPRMVALSHPHLRPEKTTKEIKKYSQHFVDLIDLAENRMRTLPVVEVISANYPGIRLLASLDKGDYIQSIFALGSGLDPSAMVLTFDGLARDATFVPAMKAILKTLEEYYQVPVDVEFTLDVLAERPRPKYSLHLLQCRPLISQDWGEGLELPANIPEEDKLFSAHKLVPQGVVSNIDYIVYVDPEAYGRIVEHSVKFEIGRIIGRLNKRLENERFILMGPGRWGSSNIDLGVKVTYADIYNTCVLVEIAMGKDGETPEVSYGTHFFQDLVESGIYPLPLYPDDEGVIFNRAFLDSAPNVLSELLPADAPYADLVKVIDLAAASGGRFLEVVMDGEQEQALAYLTISSKVQSSAKPV
jgi:hypothetical protein